MVKWSVKRNGSPNAAKQYKVVDDKGALVFNGELNQCSRAAAKHNAEIDMRNE